ncbi:MAG: hypothetical protein KAX49_03865 [Halanaerobiales bacterium]|nr:hypothetical protein [Halanaerobiales bacterium]
MQPTVRFRYTGYTPIQMSKQLTSRLFVIQGKTLRVLKWSLRKNCPYSKRPKRESHPNEPRMRDAIRSTKRGCGIYGGRVYIDTFICPHAYYYTYGRSGGRMIYPHPPKKVLSIVKLKEGIVVFRKWARLGSMRGNTKYLSDTVIQTEPVITKMYSNQIGVWISSL